MTEAQGLVLLGIAATVSFIAAWFTYCAEKSVRGDDDEDEYF